MDKKGFPPANSSGYPSAPPTNYAGYASAPPIANNYPSASYNNFPQSSTFIPPLQGPPPAYDSVSYNPAQANCQPAIQKQPVPLYANPQYQTQYWQQPQQRYPQQQGPVYPQSAVYVAAPPATFDAGARFDHVSSRSVPPPPPGCVPNAAQLGYLTGVKPEEVKQNKKSFWSGGSSGGYTFW